MTAHDTPQSETPEPEDPPSGRQAGRREWWGLAVLALPTVLLSVDITVLYLALPQLSADLGANGVEQLWIMDIYTFMLAGFLITMGAVGDRVGRRKLLLIGAALFGVASTAAAFSTSPEMLILTRALMGVAGATLMPSTLALITNMFPDSRQRGAAIGVWAACLMVGAAVGPVVGGVLLDAFWWGSVFLLGVPIMVVLLVAGPLLLPEFRDDLAVRVDPVSVVLSLVAILGVVFGLKEVAHYGPTVLAVSSILVGLVVGLVFVRRQRWVPGRLLDPRLFANPAFGSALTIIVLGGILLSGIFLLVSQHLQLVIGLSAAAAGLWLAPVGLSVALGAVLAPSIAQRLGPAPVIASGLVISGVGCVLLTQVDGAGGLAPLMVGIIVVYLGVGPSTALGVDLVVGSAPPEQAGRTSAVSESATELGAALGIALVGSLATAVYRGAVEVPAGVPADQAATAEGSITGALEVAAGLPADLAERLLDSSRAAFTSGLNTTSLIGAFAFVALAALALTFLRKPAETAAAQPAIKE